MSALRALFRVELRQLQKNKGRSWLVMLLVAAPVAAIVGASTLLQITVPTVEENRVATMGQASLQVRPVGNLTLAQAREMLPEGVRSTTVGSSRVYVRSGSLQVATRASHYEPGALEPGGLAEGMLVLVEGRAPVEQGEVALSKVLLAHLKKSVGETVLIDEVPCDITGSALVPDSISAAFVLCASQPGQEERQSTLLVEAEDAAAKAFVGRWKKQGYEVVKRAQITGPDGFEQLVVFVIGGVGLLEAALIVAAAFAVGLRRRQREIGLLSATGADRTAIRFALVSSAGALALAGGLLGAIIGAAISALFHPHLDEWNGRLNGPFELVPLHIAAAILLGIISAVLAVAIPSQAASKVAVKEALGGRRPVTSGSSRWLILGGVMVVSALTLLLTSVKMDGKLGAISLLSGSVLGVLGFGACSPWLLDRLAHLAGRLPLAWRLAVRDAGRFRARNGPVVTAVLAGMSISVTVAALLTSLRRMPNFEMDVMRDDWLVIEGLGAEQVARELAGEFTLVASAPLAAAHSRGRGVIAATEPRSSESAHSSWIACGEPELLSVLGVVDDQPKYHNTGLVALHDHREAHTGASFPRMPEGTVAPELDCLHAKRLMIAPGFVMTEEELERLEFEPGPPPGSRMIPWIVRLDQPISREDLDRAEAIAAATSGTTIDAQLLHLSPTRSFYQFVLLVCHATGLIILCVATTLSAVESAADARVLETVGAPPSLLRAVVSARTTYLAILGCVLAIPAGMFPAAGLISLASVSLELVMPWPEILITVLGLPLTAYCGAWLLASLPKKKAL